MFVIIIYYVITNFVLSLSRIFIFFSFLCRERGAKWRISHLCNFIASRSRATEYSGRCFASRFTKLPISLGKQRERRGDTQSIALQRPQRGLRGKKVPRACSRLIKVH